MYYLQLQVNDFVRVIYSDSDANCSSARRFYMNACIGSYINKTIELVNIW